MRPVIEIVETDRGYVVKRFGRHLAGPVREFMDAVIAAQRAMPGVVLTPGEVPDTDTVAVGYPAEVFVGMEVRAS